MIRAYKSYWKNYFNFKERTSRKDYWLVVLMNFIVTFVVFFIIGFIMGLLGKEVPALTGTSANEVMTYYMEFLKTPAGILAIIWSLANLIPGIAIVVRRLHDANFSGWFYLLILIPYIGSIILVIFMLLPSKEEGQRFGLYA